MTDFLITSTLSMLVCLSAYHIFLKREKMHQFNRFYLLFTLALSFIIPFMTIEFISTSIAEPAKLIALPYNELIAEQTQSVTVSESVNYISTAGWLLYLTVTLLLSCKFIVNIVRFKRKINTNTAVKYKGATLILVSEKTLPYTFLQYIFLNIEEYRNNTIENELYTHELTHVRQKHTLDILFIEVLKTIFWFNPILYFYKKAIQLNHEFLADEKVVNSFNDTPFYQKLLLAKVEGSCTFNLASSLTYSITKQRLLMMTKSTSKGKSVLLKAVFTPALLIGLVLIFSFRKVENTAVKSVSDTAAVKPTGKNPTAEQWNEWKNDENTTIWINNWQVKKSDLEKYDPTVLFSFSEDFISHPNNANLKQQEVFLYTQQGFEDYYNSLERPKPIEYQEILKLRPKEGC